MSTPLRKPHAHADDSRVIGLFAAMVKAIRAGDYRGARRLNSELYRAGWSVVRRAACPRGGGR